ncbi:AEL087Cp [Eremothecium gossypii ATCC 10895]|uniref:tRNA-5-taurinomethyluridine 2-sulfurtransferase n=1 Tax=Eremothecium gossypii (strain ATCC 10895 / CBS 109.51 / FGSC 9923 / NRRL Y-1056) TaxID=284811 RepID=Q757U9_EREGS|nr:AEL087Cp [Eremothecium gossypii ATCC 10895]AAS52598.2 AEL087Cp [Eremothecium gossypii ATCC 10895]AEY96900.1 FAEL087Cp [Eremothecium gossypii FDAG1]
MYKSFIDICARRQTAGYRLPRVPSTHDNIIVAMSGGVDSSVCAALYAHFPKVRGLYMQNWSQTSGSGPVEGKAEPCYEQDWKDIEKVGAYLNIPVERVNFERDYWLDVFEPMLQRYQQGYTPNPDIGCNRFVKFGALREHLDKEYGRGNYWLVTGHYARILSPQTRRETHLLRSHYAPKDQSYYLSQVGREALADLLMPMGFLTKPEVRQWAAELHLPNATKPDSQGICFVNNSQHGRFQNFLQEYLPSSVGHIVTVEEESGTRRIWGQHRGIWSYTIGQRVGISLPQGDPKYQGAWYVSHKDPKTNTIEIVKGRDNRALYKDTLSVSDFESLVPPEDLASTLEAAMTNGELYMQFRSLQQAVKVTRLQLQDSGFELQLATAQRAMAPGQYCCLYHNDRVLGSGTVRATF